VCLIFFPRVVGIWICVSIQNLLVKRGEDFRNVGDELLLADWLPCFLGRDVLKESHIRWVWEITEEEEQEDKLVVDKVALKVEQVIVSLFVLGSQNPSSIKIGRRSATAFRRRLGGTSDWTVAPELGILPFDSCIFDFGGSDRGFLYYRKERRMRFWCKVCLWYLWSSLSFWGL